MTCCVCVCVCVCACNCEAAVQQRQVTGNTHVFDRPRATASVSSALLTELNTTLNCLKVWRVCSMHVYVMRRVNQSSSFIV